MPATDGPERVRGWRRRARPSWLVLRGVAAGEAKRGDGQRGRVRQHRSGGVPTLRSMARRAFTGLGAGRTADEALASAEVPPSLSRVGEIAVPEGENPSKVGTFVQRVALDPAAI